MTEQEIHRICKEYNIENYSINPDRSIDVNGDVHLQYNTFSKLPLKFNKVSGYFDCSSCFTLSTLEGSPNYVSGNFNCSWTWIESLEHCPLYIGGGLYAYHTKLKSLYGYNMYDKLHCDNKEKLILKDKRSKKLKLLKEFHL